MIAQCGQVTSRRCRQTRKFLGNFCLRTSEERKLPATRIEDDAEAVNHLTTGWVYYVAITQ